MYFDKMSPEDKVAVIKKMVGNDPKMRAEAMRALAELEAPSSGESQTPPRGACALMDKSFDEQMSIAMALSKADEAENSSKVKGDDETSNFDKTGRRGQRSKATWSNSREVAPRAENFTNSSPLESIEVLLKQKFSFMTNLKISNRILECSGERCPVPRDLIGIGDLNQLATVALKTYAVLEESDPACLRDVLGYFWPVVKEIAEVCQGANRGRYDGREHTPLSFLPRDFREHFEAVAVSGDGNCAWHSVSLSLFGDYSGSAALRLLTAAALLIYEADFRAKFAEWSRKFGRSEISYDVLLTTTLQLGVWSDENHLFALSLAVRRPIYCYGSFGDFGISRLLVGHGSMYEAAQAAYERVDCIGHYRLVGFEVDDQDKEPICVYYNGSGHYSAVLPKDPNRAVEPWKPKTLLLEYLFPEDGALETVPVEPHSQETFFPNSQENFEIEKSKAKLQNSTNPKTLFDPKSVLGESRFVLGESKSALDETGETVGEMSSPENSSNSSGTCNMTVVNEKLDFENGIEKSQEELNPGDVPPSYGHAYNDRPGTRRGRGQDPGPSRRLGVPVLPQFTPMGEPRKVISSDGSKSGSFQQSFPEYSQHPQRYNQSSSRHAYWADFYNLNNIRPDSYNQVPSVPPRTRISKGPSINTYRNFDTTLDPIYSDFDYDQEKPSFHDRRDQGVQRTTQLYEDMQLREVARESQAMAEHLAVKEAFDGGHVEKPEVEKDQRGKPEVEFDQLGKPEVGFDQLRKPEVGLGRHGKPEVKIPEADPSQDICDSCEQVYIVDFLRYSHCDHSFCLDCLGNYLLAEDCKGDGVTFACPVKCCRLDISKEIVSEILSRNHLEPKSESSWGPRSGPKSGPDSQPNMVSESVEATESMVCI